MKKILSIGCLLVVFIETGLAQVKEIKGVTLSPEQQRAVNQKLDLQVLSKEELEEMARSEEEEALVFRPRTRDAQRLRSIPSIPLTKTAQLTYIKAIRSSLEMTMEPSEKQSLQQYASGKSANLLNHAAVLTWLQNRDQQAVWMALTAAQSMPDSAMAWNNLAAMFTMSRMEELAIPLLKYTNKQDTGNAVTLNNLGQAYLGLGDISTAEGFLKDCLARDPSHPEATRSMGVVELSKGNKEEAAEYFEEDLRNHLRQSSFEWLKQAKKRQDISLNDLRKEFLRRKKMATKDFYGMIALQDLQMPQFPLTAAKSSKWQADHEIYAASLQQEFQYWMDKSTENSEEEKRIAIHTPEAYFSWLVNETVYELTTTYADALLPSSDFFVGNMVDRTLDYQQKLQAVKCPDAPPGSDIEVLKAYDRKCCAMQEAVINNFMAAQNEQVRRTYDFRNGQWKIFLNELINVVEVYPTPDNKKLVYRYLAQYANFLQGSAALVIAEERPSGCEGMTLEEATEVLKKSKRSVELKCPAWLHYQLPFPGVGSVTMNCSEFQVEATPIGIVKAGFKKKFKDQTTTLYVGVGPKLSTRVASVSAGVEGYLVFDRQDQLVNTGILAEAKMELPQGLAELSATAKVEMNSGYSHEVKADSRWVERIKTTYSKY